MLLVGIAAGMRGKTKIGEVVISERVVGYELAALVRKPESCEAQEAPRPDIIRPSYKMRQLLAAYISSDTKSRVAEILASMKVGFPGPPEGHEEARWRGDVASEALVALSTIASGEKLLRNPEKLVSLRANMYGKIEVGEMEASGFGKSCEADGRQWAVVRGISDFGDDLKDDRFHELAADCAAATALDLADYFMESGDFVHAA